MNVHLVTYKQDWSWRVSSGVVYEKITLCGIACEELTYSHIYKNGLKALYAAVNQRLVQHVCPECVGVLTMRILAETEL